MIFTKYIKNKIKYCYITLITITFFLWWISNAGDLLWQIMEPSHNSQTTINLGRNVDTVWETMLEWSIELETGGKKWIKNWPSIIVKATRILLSLVIALSVTMILYNGIMYIVETWKWKEWNELIKNVAYIVIWILLALFSVVIITLLQSVPQTLEDELITETSNQTDNELVDSKAMTFKEFINKF